MIEEQTPAADIGATEDLLHRFSFDGLPVRGQWVRLNQALVNGLKHHRYPDPIACLMGQMFAAVSMFADNLKFAGAVTLQSSGQGTLTRSLAECRNQQYLRGVAQLSESGERPDNATLAQWLGKQATLALSLIPDDINQSPYQGMVALDSTSLQHDLEHYFEVSEQLPTRLFLTSDGNSATGLLLQRLPSADLATEVQLAEHEEGWNTVCVLADTLTDQELAKLSVRELLRRLFHELPCRLQDPRRLSYRCTCSRSKTDTTLHMLGAAELREILLEQGQIEVGCELCGITYRYDEIDVARLIKSGPNQPASDALH